VFEIKLMIRGGHELGNVGRLFIRSVYNFITCLVHFLDNTGGGFGLRNAKRAGADEAAAKNFIDLKT